MNYLAYDVGGSSVKYALVDEQGNLESKGSFVTPASLDDFYTEVVKVCQQLGKGRELAGAGFSMPGAVDNESGVIGGSSALDYIHDFPIKQALAARLGMPVSMENDANCAALGEAWTGSGRDYDSLAYFVVGTGVGGAVVHDKKIIHGPHQHGGEFGYMVMNDEYEILSEVGSTGGLCRQLAKLLQSPVPVINLLMQIVNILPLRLVLSLQPVNLVQQALRSLHHAHLDFQLLGLVNLPVKLVLQLAVSLARRLPQFLSVYVVLHLDYRSFFMIIMIVSLRPKLRVPKGLQS